MSTATGGGRGKIRFLTFYRGIPPLRSARMVRLAVVSPPDGLEYGRVSSNNNEEGCGAASCLLSKSGLVVRAAVPQLPLEGTHSADYLEH